MKVPVLFLLMLAAGLAQAEAFKCQTSSGQVVFSDSPCYAGERFEKVRPSESAADPERARQEVERQRVFAERQAAENAVGKTSSGLGIMPDQTPPSAWPTPAPVSPPSSFSR